MRDSFANVALVRLLPLMPKPLVWRFSRRYIAGTSLESALQEVARLNAAGVKATIDVLGEDSRTSEQVELGRDLYLRALQEIGRRGLDAGISVKLSEMGLRFDPGLCRGVVDQLAAMADAGGLFLRIDMEDSSVTGQTLEIYRWIRRRRRAVGTVIQAYLRRSDEDVRSLLDQGIAHIRLCKGIYREASAIAFQEPEQISESFRGLLEKLLRGGAEHVAIASHDPNLIAHAESLLRELGVSRQRYEFQMLLGVAEGLRRRLVADGHPVRVYVPFGERWFAYSKRRMKENPQIAGHIIGNLLRRR